MKKQCKTCGYLKDNFKNTDIVKAYDKINKRYSCVKFGNEIKILTQKCSLYKAAGNV